MSLLLEYSINHFDDLNILKEGFGARAAEKRESISTDSSSSQGDESSSDRSDNASPDLLESTTTTTTTAAVTKPSEPVIDLKEQMHSDIEKENQLELERLFFGGSTESRDENDFLVDNNHWLIKNGSSFDKLLIFRWLRAMEMGAFKFNIEKQMPTRYLEGKFNFLCQINGKRITEKRPTELKRSSISLDFDSNKFNFTRINDIEILFKLSNQKSLGEVPSSKAIEQYVSLIDDTTHESSTAHKTATKNPGDNFIIINNSPIELGHILLLPQMYTCSRQVLNLNAIRLATDVSLLTNSNGLFIGFNSLGAYASVNHLHLHAYYCGNKLMSERRAGSNQQFPLPIQNVKHADLLTSRLWMIDESYFFPAFVVQLCDFDNNCEAFAEAVLKITTYFNQNEVSHNVVFVKSRPFSVNPSAEQSENTIRVNIWPRKSSYDTPENPRNLAFAICEMAGHFFMKDEQMLSEISEQEIIELSKHSRYDATRMDTFKADIIALFSENSNNNF